MKLKPYQILLSLTTLSTLSCGTFYNLITTNSQVQQQPINTPLITEPLPATPTIIREPVSTETAPNYQDTNEQQVGKGIIFLPFVVLSNQPQLSTQQNTPAYVINFIHPEQGCSYLGIAGQVFDLIGNPVSGKIIEISGKINNLPILLLGLTGSAPAIGPGGFELKIADTPFDSQDSIFIQIFDIDGKPLSAIIPIRTYADCSRNLIIINFKVNPEGLVQRDFIPITLSK